MHVYAHDRIHAYVHTRMSAYMHGCVHVCMSVRVSTLVGVEPMLRDSEAPLFRLHLVLRQVAAE